MGDKQIGNAKCNSNEYGNYRLRTFVIDRYVRERTHNFVLFLPLFFFVRRRVLRFSCCFLYIFLCSRFAAAKNFLLFVRRRVCLRGVGMASIMDS